MAQPNLELLSDTDLELLSQGRMEEMSDTSLRYLAGEEFGLGETALGSARRSVTSSLRGLGIMQPDGQSDQQAESEARIMEDVNPVTGVLGRLGGGLLDPVQLPAFVLAPIRIGGAILTGAARGAAAGGAGGAVEPVYPEFGDTRTTNILTGGVGGAVLGGALGAILKKFGIDMGDPQLKEKVDQLPPEAKKQVNEAAMADAEGPQVKTAKEEANFPDKPLEWNAEAKTFQTVEDVIPEIDTNLPRNLSGAKPRFNKFETEFDNGLDKAFYIIGNPTSKSSAHDAYAQWLSDLTGLSGEELKAAARGARSELVKRLAKAPEVDGKLKVDGPTTVTQTILDKLRTPQRKVTPVAPKRVVAKESLDQNDLALLEKAGAKVILTKNNQVMVQDLTKPNKPFMTNAEFQERMRASGIELDLSGYRQRQKAPAAAPEVPPEDIGVPKQGVSMGSAAARPESYLGPELNPKAAKMNQEEFLLNMMMTDDPRVAIPDSSLKGKGTIAAAKQRGAVELKKILSKYGDMAQFMLAKKGKAENMTESEVIAFRWFYADAMKKRDDVVDRLVEIVSRGENMDTPEVDRLADDLVYLSGVDLFYKNDGTKASRAFAARKVLKSTVEQGLTPQTKLMRGLFPGTGC